MSNIFHPNEIAICGFSNSGKTTLIEKLVSKLSRSFKIAAIKHDAHHFEVDKKGKDTYRFVESGARSVLISNDQKYCWQSYKSLNELELGQLLLDEDLVIVEGHKKSNISKLVMIDQDELIIPHLESNEISNIEGIIVSTHEHLAKYKSLYQKVFHRDDIDSICNYLIEKFSDTPKLKALILAGGKGSRMGQDKGTLKYFDSYQTHHLYKVLKKSIDEVYISIRQEQKHLDHVKDLPHIYDVYPSKGPCSAILSAFETDPNAAWLVVAIDQPFLDSETIEQLIEKRDHFKIATCYENPHKKWPEPLCTIWEPKSKLKLFQYWAVNKTCPRKILFNSEINLLELKNTLALENCNTPKEYQNAKDLISRGNYATN